MYLGTDVGIFDGAVLAALFGATFPHRTRALVTWMLAPRVLRATGYPWGIDASTYERWIGETHEGVGLEDLRERLAPSRADDEPGGRRRLDRVFIARLLRNSAANAQRTARRRRD